MKKKIISSKLNNINSKKNKNKPDFFLLEEVNKIRNNAEAKNLFFYDLLKKSNIEVERLEIENKRLTNLNQHYNNFFSLSNFIKYLFIVLLKLIKYFLKKFIGGSIFDVKLRILLERYFPSFLIISGSLPESIKNIDSMKVPKFVNFDKNNIHNIFFSTNKTPMVSIIIPIFGQIKYTLNALNSIKEMQSNVSFEVIVVDDKSTDNSVNILKKIKGIRLIQNSKNLGFISTCNKGAKFANSNYLVFLNNDVHVNDFWLDNLLKTFNDFSNVGLVGSKLLYPDGTLQEAGSIIWNDGSGLNYGKYQNNNNYKYNFAREVDYCSGSSLMISSKLFNSIKGFNSEYSPAYYEDVDLAFNVRKKGYKVIYQPTSEIIHYESISMGSSSKTNIKNELLNKNKQTFIKNWKRALINHAVPSNTYNALNRNNKFKILFVDTLILTPNKDAGSLSIFNIMLIMREMGFDVSFFATDERTYNRDEVGLLERNGFCVPSTLGSSFLSFIENANISPDFFYISRPNNGFYYIDLIKQKFPMAKIIYDTIDVHFIRMEREKLINKTLSQNYTYKNIEEMRKMEIKSMNSAAAAVIRSKEEMKVLAKIVPESNLNLFSLVMNVKKGNVEYKNREGIIFIGNYNHPPNVDAVNYFMNSIYKDFRISEKNYHENMGRAHFKRIPIYFVGSHMNDQFNQFNDSDLFFKGFVDDIEYLFNSMRLSFVPLRYGAGVKGKIASSMAAGLPVVSSEMGVEGMSLSNNSDIIVSKIENSDTFSNDIINLYYDEKKWNRIRKAGLISSKKLWGAKAASQEISKIFKTIGVVVKPLSKTINLYE